MHDNIFKLTFTRSKENKALEALCTLIIEQ